LRGGAATAANHLHVAGEQDLERLAAALEENEINVQSIAFERADFLGDIQKIDAAADARQAKEDLFLVLGRKGSRTQQKKQKRRDRSLHGVFLSMLSSRQKARRYKSGWSVITNKIVPSEFAFGRLGEL